MLENALEGKNSSCITNMCVKLWIYENHIMWTAEWWILWRKIITAMIFLQINMCILLQELLLHEDRVRAMCLTDYGQVISGPGSRDGRLAVWRSDLWQLVPGTEPSIQRKKVHTDEDNDFELVPKQCIVKFNLVQDDTACYFNRTSTY